MFYKRISEYMNVQMVSQT